MGLSLNYITRGNGKPVVLIHGMAASYNDWKFLAPELHQAGYRTYEVDLLGHGDSYKPGDLRAYTIMTVFQALENWITCLEDEPPFILIGHSMGGYLSLIYALTYPERISQLILIDPFVSVTQLSPLFRFFHRHPGPGMKALKWVPRGFIAQIMGFGYIKRQNLPLRIRQQISIDIKRASPYILNLPRTVHDLSPELSRLELPVLMIWGDQDLTLNPGSFRSLMTRMRNVRGFAIPNCGHQPHLIKPEIVNQLVLNFLQQSFPPQHGT